MLFCSGEEGWFFKFSFSAALCCKVRLALSSSIANFAIAFWAFTWVAASPSSIAFAKISWALSNWDLTLAEYSVT